MFQEAAMHMQPRFDQLSRIIMPESDFLAVSPGSLRRMELQPEIHRLHQLLQITWLHFSVARFGFRIQEGKPGRFNFLYSFNLAGPGW